MSQVHKPTLASLLAGSRRREERGEGVGSGGGGAAGLVCQKKEIIIKKRNCHMWSNIVKGCRAAWPVFKKTIMLEQEEIYLQ